MMYLWALLISAAAGCAAAVAALVVGEGLRRRGSTAGWMRWAGLGTGVLGALFLIVGFASPRLRGRTPPPGAAEFTPIPFTDPVVLSCGLGAFALLVGAYLIARGDRTWAARVGLGAGAVVMAVWLFYLIGRFVT
ncbi:hypothetical protein [Tessaracoccus sp. G1721]